METLKVNHAKQPSGRLMTLPRNEFFKLAHDLAENDHNFPTFNNEKMSALKISIVSPCAGTLNYGCDTRNSQVYGEQLPSQQGNISSACRGQTCWRLSYWHSRPGRRAATIARKKSWRKYPHFRMAGSIDYSQDKKAMLKVKLLPLVLKKWGEDETTNPNQKKRKNI
jgi:hypothetical protein